jgi:hypothetical protein
VTFPHGTEEDALLFQISCVSTAASNEDNAVMVDGMKSCRNDGGEDQTNCTPIPPMFAAASEHHVRQLSLALSPLVYNDKQPLVINSEQGQKQYNST